MAGIERIAIDNPVKGSGAWRFDVAKNYTGYINRLYRHLFELADGESIAPCKPDDKLGRYDRDFGVDVILSLKSGQTITVQEKVLTTNYDTVTVEYYQNGITGEQGDWFKLKCDLYFVGYASGKKDTSGEYVLDRFILLDWLLVRIAHDNIGWMIRENKKDGAKANFKYAKFSQFPDYCTIAKLADGKFTLGSIMLAKNKAAQ